MPNRSFERRTFLKMLRAGLVAGMIWSPRLVRAFSPPSNLNLSGFVPGRPEWIVHEDGTFDIYAGSIRLTNCRPTINGQSIFVRNTFMGDSPKGKRIIYEIDGGFVMLDLRTHSNSISIGAEISGMAHAPALVNPLGEGYLSGANRFFKQSFGTGGQSGIFGIRKSTGNKLKRYPEEEAWSYDSFLTTGLIADNGDTLSVGAYEITDFIQRSTISNRPDHKGQTDSLFKNDAVFFDAGFITENIPLKDEFIKLPDLFLYHGNQPYQTMQNLVWQISEQNQARYDTATNYFWTSFQDFHTSFSYTNLLDQLKILDELKPAVSLQTIQIGPGYCVPGDWLKTTDNWPKSMEDAARQIFQRKYRAGIYVAPFVAHEKSEIYHSHPHWILRNSQGVPMVMGEDTNGKLFALDGSHPDVKDYLAKVFRSFLKMGFRYFELDYLDWGLQDSSDVQRARKGKSSVQIFRAVMETIREAIGAGSFITANKTPYSPLIGLVDAVRIDKDQSWKWDGTTEQIIQESYNTQYFNNVFWQNDPDVVFLRDYQSGFTNNEQKSLALWAGFIGGAFGISDNFKIMASEKLHLWRFLEPAKRPQSAILPFWGADVKNKVAVRRYKNTKAWGVLILNDTNETVSESYSISDLIGNMEAWVFVWEPGFSLGLGNSGKISVNLSSHESKLYYLSEENENPSLDLKISGKESFDE